MRVPERSKHPDAGWQEVSDLAIWLGGEEHLAQRIAIERQARGWSGEQLARRMAEAGHPIPQSAISKIEKSVPRRAITVDEARGFANVFDIPLLDLLLPPGAWNDIELGDAFRDGPGLAKVAEESNRALNNAVTTVAAAIERGEAPVVGRLMADRERLRRRGQGPRDEAALLFIRHVLRAVDRDKLAREGMKLPGWAVEFLDEEQGA